MTRDQLVTFVLERLTIPATDTAKVTQAERRIESEYQRLVAAYDLQVERAELPVSADDPLVDLPDDWIKIIRLRAGTSILEAVNFAELLEREAASEAAGSALASSPLVYCLTGPNRIRIDPPFTADDTDGLILDYVARPPALSGSDEPELLPTAFHDLLGERAVVHLALVEEEPGLANAAKAEADRLEAELGRLLATRSSEGTISTPTPRRA